MANVPPMAKQRKQPQTVSIETSKLVLTTTASEVDPADVQKIEKREPIQNYPTRFVAGNRVAFRSGPSTGDTIIYRFDNGRQVLLSEESGEWSQIKDQLTQRDGWIASRFLANRPKLVDENPRKRKQRERRERSQYPRCPIPPPSSASFAESLAIYPSSCAYRPWGSTMWEKERLPQAGWICTNLPPAGRDQVDDRCVSSTIESTCTTGLL